MHFSIVLFKVQKKKYTRDKTKVAYNLKKKISIYPLALVGMLIDVALFNRHHRRCLK